jgi:hypothetical protein
MRRVLPYLMTGVLVAPGFTVSPGATDAGAQPSRAVTLEVDARLIAEAAEVWALIAEQENPIWPGWNASDTPILFYLPGKQDVLINHPRPPDGFAVYGGPVLFPRGRIMVRDGPTILKWDGQNTSRVIEGIPTLVVADPLSNLRQQIGALLEDPRPAAEKATVDFSQLATDPYHQLSIIVHEAFHVFQARAAPGKIADEMLLLHYPVLSVDNNVGFALEGKALAAALRSEDPLRVRDALLRFLAVRRERRATLPAKAVEYENGVEFLEGLAKYTEYRLLHALEGRTPRPEMWWVQGFRGYDDLAPVRSGLVDSMLRHMRGEVSVNNDPHGTAPLRMRLYYSGMMIGAALDRLSADWKGRILQPDVSLTGLVEDALRPGADELRKALDEARRDDEYEALVAAKTRLAREGRARIDGLLAEIERGDGTGVVVEYGGLATPRVGLAFTPFGLIVVDGERTIYTQVPIEASFPDGAKVAQTEPRPLLHDKKRRWIRFRLPRELSRQELAGAVDREMRARGEVGELKFEVPGFSVNAPSATLQREGRDLRIVLRPPRP